MVAALAVALAAGCLGSADANVPASTPAAAPPPATDPNDPNALDRVLQDLQDKAAGLKSYQVNMDYVFKQPLLESQQRRTGVLYYAKLDGRSSLRIDFQTLQQDEEKPQTYRQQYLFDGVWLWEIDHQLKTATRRQLTEPNQPVDAFSLASKHVPVLGFSKVEDLRRQFEITLVPEPATAPTPRRHLHLKVKPDSAYQDDYVTIDVWIDSKIGLPVRVEAGTPEEDVYVIQLADPKVNTELEPKLFQVDLPRDFSVEVVPLQRKTTSATGA
jgi:outer membrane lipoprotein-sorting protein